MKWVAKYLFSLIYALSTSLSFIYIQRIEESLPPILCLFVSIFITVIFFHFVNFKSIFSIYKKMIHVPLLWILINGSLAIIWGTSFYGTEKIGGFAFLYIYFISSAIISYVILILKEKKSTNSYQIISAVGLLTLTSLFIVYNFSSLIGIILAISGGIFSYIYRKLSFTIAERCKLSASQRLTTSYYLIIFFSPLLIQSKDYLLLNHQMFIYLGGIALLSFIIPLYANQKGVEIAGPEYHSIISAITPLLTCLFDIYINKNWVLFNLISSILGSFFLILGKIRTQRQPSVK